MEYTKQTWTAPTGTGLSRYAKSAESASHVTLTLDPENLTNSPTPFTMARMEHMEDGIAKAYDTAPPTPWAQYSGKDIPQLPDNVAGTTYKRDNDWTNTDGWTASHASITLSVEDETLKVVYDGTRPDTGLSITKSLNATGKFIKGHIKCTVPIINVGYWSGSTIVYFTLTTPNAYETDFYGYIPTAHTDLILYVNVNQITAKTCWLSQLYIGTGAYDRLVFDNSYHYRHLLNNAVVPTPQGLYFNGATSYLRSKDKVTLPDVFTFSATVNCAVKTSDQIIFSCASETSSNGGFWLYRNANISSIALAYYNINTSALAYAAIATNFFSGLDNTDVVVEICFDFLTKTITVKRNNATFNTVTLQYFLKPTVAQYIVLGASYAYTQTLLGYMRNICLFDTALTDTQRNWLAQGNTPPILYDVTNWLALETLRYNASFLLQPYSDGKKLRIANIATSTITCTLPSGRTMNGQTSFTIAPDTILEFELIETAWKCVSNKLEKIWTTSDPTSHISGNLTLSGSIEQFKFYEIVYAWGISEGARHLVTTTGLMPIDRRALMMMSYGDKAWRPVTAISGTTLTIGTATQRDKDDVDTVTTGSIIPHYIYGMK